MSFLVESRHRMLKGSVALQVGDEIIVREYSFVAAFGYRGKIVQIFEELFIVADWQHNRSTVAMLVGKILEHLTHGIEVMRWCPSCRKFAAPRDSSLARTMTVLQGHRRSGLYLRSSRRLSRHDERKRTIQSKSAFSKPMS